MSERSPPKSTRRFASEPLAVAANCRIFGSEVGVVRRKSGLTIEAFDAAGERLLQGGEVCHHSTSYLERISLLACNPDWHVIYFLPHTLHRAPPRTAVSNRRARIVRHACKAC